MCNKDRKRRNYKRLITHLWLTPSADWRALVSPYTIKKQASNGFKKKCCFIFILFQNSQKYRTEKHEVFIGKHRRVRG